MNTVKTSASILLHFTNALTSVLTKFSAAFLLASFVVVGSSAMAQHEAAGHGTEAGATHETGHEIGHESGHESGHEGEHAKGLPASVVYQGINFIIFAALGFYFLRTPVRNFFGGRRERYHKALNKAEALKRDAEAKRNEIAEKLRILEASTKQTLADARVEAEALSARIVSEANDMSRSLREEANRTALAEINRAKEHLRDDLLAQSVNLSKKLLGEKMAEVDQKRLQTEFVDKIQEVR